MQMKNNDVSQKFDASGLWRISVVFQVFGDSISLIHSKTDMRVAALLLVNFFVTLGLSHIF